MTKDDSSVVWQPHRTRDLLSFYIGGGWGKEDRDEQHTVGAWVARGTDIPHLRTGQVNTCVFRFHKPSNLRSRQLKPYDIVFEVSGGSKDQPVGRSVLASPRVLSKLTDSVMPASFCKLVRPDTTVVDPLFFFYYLQYIYTNREITQYQTQSTGISNFKFEVFLDEHTVNLPPRSTQYEIASVLSAYDDLIENNIRRIEILEEMAQRIYREWFVNFRFPGHEKVGMVDSELGPIPEGWEVKNLFDIAEVTYGFPFKSKLFTEEHLGRPVIRIRDIKAQESRTFTPEEAKSKHIVQNGDLLVGMDGDFHMGKWAGGEAYLNQRVVRFRAKSDLSPYYLFLALKIPIQQFGSTIVGTTVAHLSDRDLRTIHLPVPTEDVVQRMQDTFNPIFNLELGLRLKNRTLRHTRNLLLPKLISGEVSVEDLDVDPEEVSEAQFVK